MTKRYGRDASRAVALAMIDSVDDIGQVCEAEGIDAHYAHGGALVVARADYDLPKIEEMWEEYRSIGLEKHVALLDADQTVERMRVADAVGSFWMREGAAIQPARLARGLARAVERRGGRIVEQTTVTDYAGGSPPRLITDRGEGRGRRAVLPPAAAPSSPLTKTGTQLNPPTL